MRGTRWRRITAHAATLLVAVSVVGVVRAPLATAAGNSPPNAVDDVASTPSSTAVTIDVLANDTDPDGDALSIVTTPYPATTPNGTVDVDPAGGLLYTPNDEFVGDDTFTYDVTDGQATSTATVTVVVGWHAQVGGNFIFDPAQISKSAVLGVPTSYDLTATATGSDPTQLVHNLTITNPVPANFVVTSVSDPHCSVTSNEITCFWSVVDPLNPTVGTTVFLDPVTTGLFTNTMTVTTLEDDPAVGPLTLDYASSVYESSGTADLGASAFGPDAVTSVGDQVVMLFNGQNFGPSPAANTVLTDTIPSNFRIDGIVATIGTNDCSFVGNIVTCRQDPLTGFIEASVSVTAIAAGDWTNTATITSDTPEAAPEYAANSATTTGTVTGSTFFVSSVSPPTRAVGLRNQVLDITGGGFVSGARALVSGVPPANQTTTFVDSTHLTLAISRIPANAVIGPHDATVTNPGPGGASATCAGCLVLDRRPALTSAAPSALARGVTRDVVLTGTGFAPGATVSFGPGVTVNTAPSVGGGGTLLTVNVTIAANAAVGARTVTVTNLDGGSASRSVFKVRRVPTISTVSPSTLARGGATTVVIHGSSFGTPAPAVSFGPGVNVVNVVRNSGSKLTVSITVDPGAAIGPRDVTVTNADGGVATRVAGFNVT
jgi:uncharacterized repeat protein (TIGR01451 family)